MSSSRRLINSSFVSGQEPRRRRTGPAPIDISGRVAAHQAQLAAEAVSDAAKKAAVESARAAARAALESGKTAKEATKAVLEASREAARAVFESNRTTGEEVNALSAVASAEALSAVASAEALSPTASAASVEALSAAASVASAKALSAVESVASAEAAATASVASVASAASAHSATEDEDDVDVDEIEQPEEEGFWKLDDDYNRDQDIIDGVDNKAQRSQLNMVKDTVHQQIFVNSKMLQELERMFDCEIIFKRRNGRYAFFVRPRDTNYMIHMTNGHSDKTNEDRIFFNLSLKQEGPKKKIKTEYICEYKLDDGSICHQYGMDGKPPVLKKNKVDLKIKEKIFNPYLKLNELLEYYFGYGHRISMDTPIAILHQKIEELRIRLASAVPPELAKIMGYFENETTKEKIDKTLNKDYLFLKKFIPLQLGNKRAEDMDYRIPNKELYKTNNKFTDMLALRYATYIPPFEFTKSCDKVHTYTDPLQFKLSTPFTATDIYLHKFDKHLKEQYAMDRYELNSPDRLHRLAELVELCKSLMMNFVSISYDILSSTVRNNEREPRICNIHNIYPALIWNRGTRPVWTKKFEVYKRVFDRKLLNVDIKLLDTVLPLPITPFNLFQAKEIPYVGVFPPVDTHQRCAKAYKGEPVIPDSEKIPLEQIDLQGIEKYMFEAQPITPEILDKIYTEFFNATRDSALDEVDAKPAEYVELSLAEFREAFPQLGNISNAPGFVSAITTEQRVFQPKYAILEGTRTQTEPTSQAPPQRQGMAPSMASSMKPSMAPTMAQTMAPSMAQVLRTQIPFAQDISKVIMDIRQFKKDNLKPIPGESRRLRGIRLKQIEPMIRKLEELRRRQLETLRETGNRVPSDFGRQTMQLHQEGLVKLSRKQQTYKDESDSVSTKTKELKEEADQLRAYEQTVKSATQNQIKILMERILNEKRALYISIPNAVLDKGKETRSMSEAMYRELKTNQKPIRDNLVALEAELKKLQEVDVEEQQKIAETRARLEAEAAKREETDEEKREKQKRKMIEKDEKMVKETRQMYDKLKETEARLVRMIQDSLRTTKPDSPLNKYYNHMLTVIAKTVKSYQDYGRAVEYLASIRALPDEQKPKDKDMEMYVKEFNETNKRLGENMKLFEELQEVLKKRPDEIETIAIRLYGTVDKYSGDDRAIDTEKIARMEARRLEKEAEERRIQKQKIEEMKQILAQKEEDLEKRLAELTPEEAEAEIKRLKEEAKHKEEVYQTFAKLNTKHIEKLELLSKDLGRNKEKLEEVQTKLKNPRLAPAQRKQLTKEEAELLKTVEILNTSFEFQNLVYDHFILENESIINTKASLNEKILARIADFKMSGLVGTLETKQAEHNTYLLENERFIRNNTNFNDKVKVYLIKKLETLSGHDASSVAVPATSSSATVDTKKKASEQERKQYMEWEREHTKIYEQIKQMEGELKGPNPTVVDGGLMRRLKDINLQLSNPNMSDAKKKKYVDEKTELEKRIKIISSALDKIIRKYNNFLLESESLIRNNQHFKDKRLRTQLIEKIETYKEPSVAPQEDEVEVEVGVAVASSAKPITAFPTYGFASASNNNEEEGETFNIYG